MDLLTDINEEDLTFPCATIVNLFRYHRLYSRIKPVEIDMKNHNENSPTAQKFEGNWKQFVGKVKEAWGNLTNDDLDRYEGKMDQLEGHIQERTGENRQAIRDRIEKIADSVKERV